MTDVSSTDCFKRSEYFAEVEAVESLKKKYEKNSKVTFYCCTNNVI